MSQGLNVNRVVNVSISLTALLAGYRNFGSAIIIGSSPYIDVFQRKRDYNDIEGVAADFPVTAPEYQAALVHFSQSPQPAALSIGRWAQTATPGVLHGATLTPVQRLVTNFYTITNGSMRVAVDGVPYTLAGLNFSAQTNLNGVASVIQAALVAAGAVGVRVLWSGVRFRFDIISGSTGPSSSVGYANTASAASSSAFSAQPVAGSSVTLNGSALTFVASNPNGNQVVLGATLAATLANLAMAVNTSTDPQVSKFTAVAGASTLYLYADLPGAAGNALTVSASTSPASNGTVSASPMAGGVGTDISVLTGLSVTPTGPGLANANPPVNGIAAESALACISLLGDMFGDWYCAEWAPLTPLADSDAVAVAGYIEAAGQARIQGLTTQNTAAIDPTRSDDLGSLLDAANFGRSFVAYSSGSPYAAAAIFGRFATINYTGSNTTITGKFKQQPSVTAEYLTASAANTLTEKNYNVYAEYQNGTAITQEAVMANGTFIDSRINADWIANYIQTNVYNLLLSLGKVPQTDQGMAIIGAVIAKSCEQARVNGYIAEGVWNASPFGTLNTGDVVPNGYYIFIPKVATQSESDRQKRKTPLIQIALKEAGAVHFADIAINVNP